MNLITEARRNLARNFRSVHVMVGTAPDSIEPHPATLARWLDGYLHAYLAAHEGQLVTALHALQGRSLTLEGTALLQGHADLAQLGQTAQRGGLGTILALPLDALVDQPQAVQALSAALPGAQLRIDCGTLGDAHTREALQACRTSLADHARRGGNLTLVGDVATLKAAGLYADPCFNGIFVAVHARPHPGVRHQQRAHAFAPCRDYIAWFIDSAGEIYPCAGMAGHPAARFGSIDEPFDNLFDALAYTVPRIEVLAQRGPHPLGDEAVFPADLCALHRQRVHGIATL